MGAALLEVNDELINEIEHLAALGLTQSEIAHCLGVCPSTWYNYKKEYEALGDAVGRGKALGVRNVSDVLYNLCLQGNMDAIKTFLKICHGKTEKMEIEANVEGLSGIEWTIQPVAPLDHFKEPNNNENL